MAETRIPAGPIEAAPWHAIGYEPGHLGDALRDALDQALNGVELGDYDRRMIAWAVDTWDQPTMATICSWLHRVRALAAEQDGGEN